MFPVVLPALRMLEWVTETFTQVLTTLGIAIGYKNQSEQLRRYLSIDNFLDELIEYKIILRLSLLPPPQLPLPAHIPFYITDFITF